jgi:hypothetical protein
MAAPDGDDNYLQDVVEQRAITSAIDLAVELDTMSFQSLDNIGLVETAQALSKWRDQLG